MAFVATHRKLRRELLLAVPCSDIYGLLVEDDDVGPRAIMGITQ